MFRLVLFDLDGTLLNTLDDLHDSVNHALKENGFPLRTHVEIRRFLGNGVRRLVEQSCPDGTPESVVQIVLQDFLAWYKTHNAVKTKPYPGIPELLSKLKNDGIKIAVVSNKADFAVQSLCKDYFPELTDFAIGEREGIRKKPAPDMVFSVLQRLGIPADQAIYVGDSEVDWETAKNAEMRGILCSWGFRDRIVLEQFPGVQIADSPEELIKILHSPDSVSDIA